LTKTALKAIFSAQRDPETAVETAADELANAIEGSQKDKDEQAIREMSHKLAAMKNEYKKMAEAFARKYGDSKFTRFLK
jgi:hypothetical protein